MREDFYEETANPTNLKSRERLNGIYTILFWVNIFIGSLFLYLSMASLVFLVITAFFALGAVFFFFVSRKFYYCVDYIFVSGSTRIVKVVKFKTRKKMIIFESNEVYQVGSCKSQSFDKLLATPGIKKIVASPNQVTEDWFYVALKQQGQNYLVVMQCKEEYLSHLVNFTSRAVIEKDYGKENATN